jgi:hypothetical protein
MKMCDDIIRSYDLWVEGPASGSRRFLCKTSRGIWELTITCHDYKLHGKNDRLAPARAAQAKQPWGSIRCDGLSACLGAHWESGLLALLR